MNEFLALGLDDDVVLLHPDRRQLMILDSWARKIWDLCEDRTTAELIRLVEAPAPRVQETLQTLTRAGMIRYEGTCWVREQTRWV